MESIQSTAESTEAIIGHPVAILADSLPLDDDGPAELKHARNVRGSQALLTLLRLHHQEHAPSAFVNRIGPSPQAAALVSGYKPPEPVAPQPAPEPYVDPYREQFAEAWKMLGQSGAVNTIDPIIRACCHYFQISKVDMVSPRRNAGPVLARQVAMYLCRHLTLRSLPDIGRRFGGRDHTTVLHAVRKIERMKDTNEIVNRAVRELTSQLSEAKEISCEADSRSGF